MEAMGFERNKKEIYDPRNSKNKFIWVSKIEVTVSQFTVVKWLASKQTCHMTHKADKLDSKPHLYSHQVLKEHLISPC